MARATERPFGVSFAAGWAAITGVVLLLRAVGGGLHGTALVLLALHGDAYRSDRPDVDGSDSATRFGT
jgi:hypothetical protein